MGFVEYEELPEEAKAVWCRSLTPAEKRAPGRLPLHEFDVRKDTYRQSLWVRLENKRYVRWEIYPQPIGNKLVRIR